MDKCTQKNKSAYFAGGINSAAMDIGTKACSFNKLS